MTTYRIGSSPLVYAPGFIRWAINGAKFPRDRKQMVKIVADSWGIPKAAATALVTEKVPFALEGETVVFTA
jgi:hypothetical protein